ncbi:hypothetical protein FG91_00663 [Sphingopyxis sp. LC81]|jgi:hypothetical protein|uniref:PPM-type phosphatase domain-containing protein n=1 Tax=Sphingopyxis fribergensis TaxID=1515612 RepID=A0A0A7PNQ7_9SPHN|nr:MULTISPECIES: protein phosphatase 2C domain-containing protein [Sphingopyxis]AJA11655.1 hypothetical protein SKP52_24065 [Sphingopyxis fribergensis]KGB56447.1 hypothetical protein FG91_00663 [Sphingopyxis sp. LC81]KGB58442.1 hypothetical protein FG95_00910 [Sphingopyxis sp. LC363]PAL19311.1 hypothetical protein CD928_22725 [Sphingopyxis sp. GW247-27LB]QUM74659.1 protein phosphatase 2C domain-containing protein [Sphingopyxis granuli]
MFNVRLAETRSGAAANEDVVGYTDFAAWVIDGASGIGENLVSAVSDAQWFAQRVDRELRDLLASKPTMPFEDLFAAVIRHCRSSYSTLARRPPAGRHELPSAAIAFVRALPEKVELATLGDCRIAYRSLGGEEFAEHGDGGNIGPFEHRTKALARSILAERPEISAAELFEELRPQLVQNRAFMNVDGGYWVLGLQMEAIERADRAELPAGDWAIALASDGFLRLADMFAHLGASDLLSIENRAEFEKCYSDLRNLEQVDGSLRRHPRAKISDDVSFIRIDVHTNSVPNG